MCEKIESAIDNKLNNMIEDILAQVENIPHALYKDINEINQQIKEEPVSVKSKPAGNVFDDIEELEDLF
jgi:hypothetical protein